MSDLSTIITKDESLRLAELYTNAVWEFLFKENLSQDEKDSALNIAHAAALIYHQHGESLDWVRSMWLISRVYSLHQWGKIALYYAEQGIKLCEEHELDAFPRAFAHESAARACAITGDKENCLNHLKRAGEYSEEITGEIEKQSLMEDLTKISNSIAD